MPTFLIIVLAIILAGLIARVLLYRRQIAAIKKWVKTMDPHPGTGVMTGAEPFFHRRGPVGCLLLHGFTGSCQELRELGDYLAQRQITVLCSLLPGHGTNPLDMNKIRREQWYRSSDDAYAQLSAECKEVFICGLSMGGLLTWRLGSKVETKGLISMASLIVVTSTLSKRATAWLLSFIVGMFVPCWTKKKIGNIKDPTEQAQRVAYLHISLRSIRELLRLGMEAWDWMRNLSQDKILMIASLHDPNPKAAEKASELYLAALPKTARLIWLKKSGHLITNDFERHKVFERVFEFIRQNSEILEV
jgi:carboxylesterase